MNGNFISSFAVFIAAFCCRHLSPVSETVVLIFGKVVIIQGEYDFLDFRMPLQIPVKCTIPGTPKRNPVILLPIMTMELCKCRMTHGVNWAFTNKNQVTLSFYDKGEALIRICDIHFESFIFIGSTHRAVFQILVFIISNKYTVSIFSFLIDLLFIHQCRYYFR